MNSSARQLSVLGMGLEDRMTAEGKTPFGRSETIPYPPDGDPLPIRSCCLLDEHTAALDPAAAAKVLELTNRVASREGMCTLMITHNMKDALHYGNRTILMKNGKIVMELAGEERKAMTVEKLIEKFSIDNDRMLP